MSDFTDDDVTAAAEVALSYGAAPGSSLHSWRCEDKERYPESCTCVTEMAHEIVTTVAPAIAARALREAADEMDEFRSFTYGPEMFVRPTKDEYAAINEVLNREFGHGTDRIAADCMDRAIRHQAERLRARAEELRNGSATARETVVQFDMDPRLPVSEGSSDE